MKKSLLFLMLAATLGAGAQQKQTLKDLLYGGKLKLDSTAVIRKSDDLSTKIDTAAKKAPEPAKQQPAVAETDAVHKAAATDTPFGADTTADAATSAAPPKEAAAPVKNNNKLWKEFTDSLTATLKTEVLPSKKIKKATYYLMLDYEIGTDGVVNVLNVLSTPENAFLQEEVKKRLTYGTPQLQPATDSNGKARKVKRKYNFTITKE